MKKQTIILKWIPLIVIFLVIMAFTLQKGEKSASLSTKVQAQVAAYLKDMGVNEETIDTAWWNDYKNFRRIAHVVEYLMLGAAAAIMMKYDHAIHFCLLISLVDEIIKAVIPGKEFDLLDMVFDAMGYVVGVGLVVLIKIAINGCCSKR